MPPDHPANPISSLTLLTQLADHAGDALLAFDRNLRCIYANRAARRLAGFGEPADDDARRWIGATAEAAFSFIPIAPLRQALEGQSSSSRGAPVPGVDGPESRFFDGQYFPLPGENGEGLGVAAVMRDVTSHQRVAQAMGEIENRFRNMADASPVLLWMAGTDGLCTFFNQTWLTFTGRSIEEEWGVGWAENVHYEDFARCMDTYVLAFNARAVFEMEYRLRRHDGEYRWILDRGTPRYTPTGGFAGYIGSCIDITERRRLEQDLRGAVQERDEFLSIASHELGTPITALRLLVETLLRALRRKIDERQTAEMVGAIEDQILRLSRLVETLLDVSRIAEGRLTLAPEPIDLTALCDRVVTRMTQVAVDAGCPVTFEAPGPVPGVWDRVRTEQVITNLLSNAFKYGAGKPVNVIVSADDHAARVRVVDRGIGIPVHKQDVIFERYERAAPKNHYGGFGLGLWITRRTLQEMGGTIRVESEEGAGALFEVELPRRQAEDHANGNADGKPAATAALPNSAPL
jgi:PAS domain S-box-containing protein